jgi:N-acetylglucosaminyldiphosphoundecaprenol N-acetyl-beta-D-mannosaminyltransferase
MKTVTVINQKLNNLSQNELIGLIDSAIQHKDCLSVATVNPEFMVLSVRDKKFAQTLRDFSLRVADGTGIVLLSRIFSKGKFKTKITGSDLIPRIINLVLQKQYKIMFFGSTGKAARAACHNLGKKYPNLLLKCYGGGLIDPNKVSVEVLSTIKAYRPDILIVGLGAPKQEYFIANYQKKLNVPVAIGAGGTIDFIAGTARRAPKMMRRLGLEWLWRLLVEPRRWRRIFNATLVFPWLYVKWIISKK